MEFVLWGAGKRGKRIHDILGADRILAFIDTYKKEKEYLGKPIIDYDQYQQYYNRFAIILTMQDSQEVVSLFKKTSFVNYFVLSESSPQLQLEGYWNYIKKILLKQKKKLKIGIFGLDLFGILIYDFLEKNGYMETGFIGDKGFSPFPSFSEVSFWDQNVPLDCIINTQLDWTYCAQKYPNVKILDVYNVTMQMRRFHNEALSAFRNIHFNKRCFIIGNGPSLRLADLQQLGHMNSITMACNMIYRVFSQLTWRPTYYFMADAIGLRQYEDEIKQLTLSCLFIGNDFPEFWENFSDRRFHRFHVIPQSASSIPAFSNDISKGVYGLATIIYICIQFAIYMGFNEIYLLGIDCDYYDNPMDKRNHFIKEYYSESDMTVPLFNTDAALLAYQSAHQYAERHGIKIYNATRGGKLEVFERVKFDDLF